MTAAVGSMAAPMIAPAPAPAAVPHPSDTCPGNTFCEWKNGGFTLPVRWWAPNGSAANYRDYTYSSDSSGLNDSISSVWNNSNRWVEVFQDKNGGGFALCLAPGGAVRDLKQIGIQTFPPEDLGDRLSSHQTYSSQPAGCNAVKSDQGCSM